VSKDSRLSFVQNMGMAMDAFGDQHLPVAYMLARASYDSVEDRDAIYGVAVSILGGGMNG
jgi:hypothetical protein